MIAREQRIITWFNSDAPIKLLPALQAMLDLTAQPGRRIPYPNQLNWNDECRRTEEPGGAD